MDILLAIAATVVVALLFLLAPEALAVMGAGLFLAAASAAALGLL